MFLIGCYSHFFICKYLSYCNEFYICSDVVFLYAFSEIRLHEIIYPILTQRVITFFKSSYLRKCGKLNLSGYVEERESMRLTLTNLCNDLVACFYVKRFFVHFLQVVVYLILMAIINIKLNFRMTSMHFLKYHYKCIRCIFLQRKGYTYIKINPRCCVQSDKRNCKAYEENIKYR